MGVLKSGRRTPIPVSQLQRRLDAGMGRIPCDLVLKNALILDVFTLSWRKANLGIVDDCLVLVEPIQVGISGRVTHDLRGKAVVPGFIDAHVHVESSLMVPRHFEAQILPRGTTTAVCDPHELANVCGVKGIEFFLQSSARMTMDLEVMLSSCVPATHLETNGGGAIPASELVRLRGHDWALGLAEMMNVPGVLAGEPGILEKLAGFSGAPLDGHAPLLGGCALSAYAAAGISSCHESSRLAEAAEKISKGVRVWIREGSVAKDLRELIPLLTEKTLFSLGFCTDDRNPLDIHEQGHLDYLIREAMTRGVSSEVAYAAASFSVARHYGLDRGHRRIGAIAPGYLADLVILADARTCEVESVLKRGRFAAEALAEQEGAELRQLEGAGFTSTVRAHVPEVAELRGPEGLVHVMGVLEGKIITTHEVHAHDAPGVCGISVLERYGKGLPPANAYVKGFGEAFSGAIGSSVGHDSHNLIAVGSAQDRRVALAELIRMGGGFCVVKDGVVLASLALPLGGLMSQQSPTELIHKLKALKQASRAVGCELEEPFLQLAFLSLPVIPALKLTDIGLVDVEKFTVISVSAG